jgi:hypothetical protein
MRFFIFTPAVSTKYGSEATAHSIAVEHAAKLDLLSSPQSRASSVADCSIGGESAALYAYADGNVHGYRLAVVHKDFLYELWLFGTGGLSDSALTDALGMMGSIVWKILPTP